VLIDPVLPLAPPDPSEPPVELAPALPVDACPPVPEPPAPEAPALASGAFPADPPTPLSPEKAPPHATSVDARLRSQIFMTYLLSKSRKDTARGTACPTGAKSSHDELDRVARFADVGFRAGEVGTADERPLEEKRRAFGVDQAAIDVKAHGGRGFAVRLDIRRARLENKK
jgi:hypothetical protein